MVRSKQEQLLSHEEVNMAQDQTDKRRNLASRAMNASIAFVDALLEMQQIAAERPVAGNFVDADFDGTSLKHMTPAMIGTLIDIVVPNLITNYVDVANGGRNKQVLNEVRP